MNDNLTLNLEDELRSLAAADGIANPPRIERVEVQGKVYWIKRPERLSLRYRLQKGDPRQAFERERAAFLEMNAAGAPVPVLSVESPDYIVLPDCGPDLRKRFNRDSSETSRRALLHQAALDLARFHGMGFSHGRPSPKDMCLVDGRVLLLDFERYQKSNNCIRNHGRDLVIFAFNVAAHSPQMRVDLPAAMAVYCEAAPEGTWAAAQKWCHKLRWTNWLTKPIQMRPGDKSREFKAIPFVLALFRSPL